MTQSIVAISGYSEAAFTGRLRAYCREMIYWSCAVCFMILVPLILPPYPPVIFYIPHPTSCINISCITTLSMAISTWHPSLSHSSTSSLSSCTERDSEGAILEFHSQRTSLSECQSLYRSDPDISVLRKKGTPYSQRQTILWNMVSKYILFYFLLLYLNGRLYALTSGSCKRQRLIDTFLGKEHLSTAMGYLFQYWSSRDHYLVDIFMNDSLLMIFQLSHRNDSVHATALHSDCPRQRRERRGTGTEAPEAGQIGETVSWDMIEFMRC